MTAQSIDRAPSFATWIAFCALCVGMFMAVLDVQVVAASLPAIGVDLLIASDKLSWIQTGYLIAEVVAIPLTGLLTRAARENGISRSEFIRQQLRWVLEQYRRHPQPRSAGIIRRKLAERGDESELFQHSRR